MLTRETAIDQAINFIFDCFKYGINVEKAILFGSIAKNEHKETSDIDIALISKQFSKNFVYNNRLTSKINIKYPLIEVHHFNTDYFNDGDPFINEIASTGYEIEWRIDEDMKISH